MRTALSLLFPCILSSLPAVAAPIEPVGGPLPELGPVLIGPTTALLPGGACAVGGSPAARVVGGVLSVDADAAPARLTVTAGAECSPRTVFVHPPLTPPIGEATLFVEAGILEAGAEGLRPWRLGLARGELLVRSAACPGARPRGPRACRRRASPDTSGALEPRKPQAPLRLTPSPPEDPPLAPVKGL